MRDIHRIYPLMFLVTRIWNMYPDLRLGQLLLNIVEHDGDLYNLEDDEITRRLLALYETKEGL